MKRQTLPRLRRLAALLVCGGLATLAQAGEADPFADRQAAVADDQLDHVRGGFSSGGITVSFGIERAVYVNGTLLTSSSLAAGTVAVIQNGSGNAVAAGSLSSQSAGTVIQNTLDGQKIQNLTVINATANSLGIYRNLNLGSSLRGAVIDSLRR